MYIVKVEDDMEYDGIYTTIVGAFLTEEKAAKYCKHKNSIRKSLSAKLRVGSNPYKDFASNLTTDETEMQVGADSSYINPTWSYEKLNILE